MLNWRLFWSKILNIVKRETRDQAIASQSVLSKHLEALVTFTHDARHYFIDAADDILAEAMEILKDTRLPSCLEGVLLLTTCLPTECLPTLYDNVLRKWVAIWTR
jgi:hypothetical protein